MLGSFTDGMNKIQMVTYGRCKPLRRLVRIKLNFRYQCFALVSHQLDDDLQCKKNLYRHLEHLTIFFLIVTEIQWFKRLLLHDSGLEPHPAQQLHTLHVFHTCTKFRRQLVAFSELLAKQMPSVLQTYDLANSFFPPVLVHLPLIVS